MPGVRIQGGSLERSEPIWYECRLRTAGKIASRAIIYASEKKTFAAEARAIAQQYQAEMAGYLTKNLNGMQRRKFIQNLSLGFCSHCIAHRVKRGKYRKKNDSGRHSSVISISKHWMLRKRECGKPCKPSTSQTKSPTSSSTGGDSIKGCIGRIKKRQRHNGIFSSTFCRPKQATGETLYGQS